MALPRGLLRLAKAVDTLLVEGLLSLAPDPGLLYRLAVLTTVDHLAARGIHHCFFPPSDAVTLVAFRVTVVTTTPMTVLWIHNREPISVIMSMNTHTKNTILQFTP